MATKDEHRAILTIGYHRFIMDAKSAAALFPVLAASGMEMYEETWNDTDKVCEPRVVPISKDLVKLNMLSNEAYGMGKLLYAASLNKQGESK
jgi:hypothetical protein